VACSRDRVARQVRSSRAFVVAERVRRDTGALVISTVGNNSNNSSSSSSSSVSGSSDGGASEIDGASAADRVPYYDAQFAAIFREIW
jgi:hypothetical protein